MITIAPVKTRPVEKTKIALGEMLDALQYTPSKSEILIKPNIVDALPARAAVDTDPAVVAGLILALNERGEYRFTIGENSGYFSSKEENFERLLKESGYQKMVETLQTKYQIPVEVVNLEFADMEKHDWKYGTLKLPVIARSHAYIDIAKMKTHLSAQVTLSLKNQKGLLLLKDKKKFHLGYGGKGDLHDCIWQLGQVIQPELAIVDATRALEGTGPTEAPEGQTSVRKLGICIAGTNATEVDNASCILMGIPVGEVQHLLEVPVTLTPKSLPLEPVNPTFRRPEPYIKYGGIYLHTSMWACTGCQMSFSRTMRKMMLVPELKEKLVKLQEKFARLDVFQGKTSIEAIGPDINRETIFMMGNCTKKLAKDLGVTHIHGCPPDHNAAIEKLLSLL